MAKRIHFEDDIFYLNVLIRTLRDGIELDLDPELFLNRVVDDLTFVDAVATRLLAELTENERLIERNEQLLNLMEAEERFSETLGRVASGRGSIAQALTPFAERFAELRASSARRRNEIDATTTLGSPLDDDPNLVSSLELNELLKGEEN